MTNLSPATPTALLAELKTFDVPAASLVLWVFKKSSTLERGLTLTGRWVETTIDLDNALKSAVNSERHRITEIQDYGLLTQNNESSALLLPTLETHAGLIIAQAGGDITARKVKNLKEIQNSAFYAIRLTTGDKVIYGIKKAGFSWRTSKEIRVFFSDNILDVATTPSFDISPTIDFFIIKDSVIISQKSTGRA